MALDGVAEQEAEEQQVFEALRPALARTDPGRFAVVCGGQLLGIFESVDEALSASSRAFDAGQLPQGTPVLISELADTVSVRVMARPVLRAAGGTPVLLA